VEIATCQHEQAVARSEDILKQLEGLQERATAIMDTTWKSGDFKTCLTSIRESRANLELLGRLKGQLRTERADAAVTADWQTIRLTIIEALSPFPSEVRSAIAQRLLALELKNEPGN
jgi:hypothetical protein